MKIEQLLLPREIFLNAPEEVKPNFQQLVELLTPWMKDLNTLINKRISFADNMACMFVDLDFTYPTYVPSLTYQNDIIEHPSSSLPAFSVSKRNGWVDIQFNLQHSASGGDVTITELPAAYWPKAVEYGIPGMIGDAPALFKIDPTESSSTVCAVSIISHTVSGTGANHHISFTHRYQAANPDPVSPGGFFPHFVDVTPLGTKPFAVIPVSCGRWATKRTINAQNLPGVVWDVNSDGKTESIRLLDTPGLSAEHRYKLRLLLVS